MSTTSTAIRFRKKRLQPYRGRGELYCWLRAHRETIASGLSTGELTWPSICEECCRHGVTSRDGLPPTRKAAQKAWQTLLRDLKTLGLKPTDKPEKPVYPSRMPKWTPPAILEAIAAGNPAVEGGGARGAIAPVAAPSTGTALALAARPPSPKPPSRPPEAPSEGKLLSQYAKPGDSIEMQQKLRAAEDQLKKFDRWMFKE
jgi:hypothetical protein